MEEVDILRKRIAREKTARKVAEKLLEERALQLYNANQQLQSLNQNLEVEVQRKTAELERQKERYQMLVDSAQDIIFVLSREGYFKYVNPIALKIVAYPPEALHSLHYTQLIDPDHLDRVKSFYQQQIAEQNQSSYLEFPIICGDGRRIWIGQNIRLQITDGEVVEWTAIARDISERVSKDREIAELNLRLSAILTNLQEGILLEDENRRIVLVNQEFCRLFGIPADPSQMIGADCSQSAEQVKYLFSDPEGFVHQVNHVLANRKLTTGDFLQLADGRIFERDFIPIYDEERYIGHLWRYQDVTEQKKVESKIRQSEEKYRGIIENMELGLMEVDRDGFITKPYPRFCEMTGYTAKELIGKSANEVFLSDKFNEYMEQQDEKRRQGQPGVYEIRMKIKGGQHKWVMISGAPFYNEEGEMIGSIGIHYDISHQKKLQHELELARQEAERARDAEKDFLANMSHEIRNPINSIVGMANLMFDTPLNDEQKEYLNNIKYSSDILLALISDILDLAKITEGKMEADMRWCDLAGTVQAICNTTQFRLRQKPVDLHLHYDNDIPNDLSSDTTFLNQILMNLLGNAVKFTHEGEISLSVDLLKKTEEQAIVKFEVKDSGIGISQNKLEHIFDRFNQAGKATASQYGGTGLGLPITKKLIELLNGQIEVSSEPGEGTCFSFQIPFPRSEQIKKTEPVDSQRSSNSIDRPLSVLIVEDNPANRLYLERTLQKWNCRYRSCENGKQALELLQQADYDLILMDIRMPEMDGYETTLRLRSDPTNSNRNVPIIALTASALKDEKKKALDAGMDHHLTKPFSPEQLRIAINRFFSFSDSSEEPSERGIHWPKPLHAETLNEQYGTDLEHAQMIFQMFLDDMPAYLQKLEEAIGQDNWETAGDIAHQVKPHFQMIGRKDLTELMDGIEDQCRSPQSHPAQLKSALQTIKHEMAATEEAIGTFLTQFDKLANKKTV